MLPNNLQKAGAATSAQDKKELSEEALRLYFSLRKHKQSHLNPEARVFVSNYQFYLENLLF
ncbi:MAG: hypothetical protein F6K36_13395 [Symploca sp. SIO3C6]|uniref:Uncharacterized protein n=1 Tax=Symploca sp. SIO1C4 TaxID=2607765 RepID=A0A6B3NK77_9CYAN|nr:hypothetical protein [Symploca sp. SIO3C6]NER30842.1 hypothetical protein [Symploca sp. SIO1C4]NET06987.1 hypothetical protein [Symploca sp. SIO2B6]